MLSDAIEVTGTWPEGVHYRFPRRNLGRGRFLIWLVVWIGLGVAYWLLAGPIRRLVLNGPAPGNIVMVAVWSSLTVLLLRFPLWFGLGLLFGHREIGLHVDSLCTGERIGSLRRSKSWHLKRLKRLQIVDLLPVVPPKAPVLGLVDHLHVLTGVLDDGKRIVIAPGYPRSLLDPFVEELSKQISLAPAESGLEARESIDGQALPDDDQRRLIACRDPQMLQETVAETLATQSPSAGAQGRVEAAPSIRIQALIGEAREAMRKSAEPDEYNQPPGSDIQVEWFPEGITLRVPPAGIWKGSAGLFQFGILWCIVIAGFTILFVGAGIAQGAGVTAVFGVLAAMSVFWLAGAGMLLGGWKMGTRECVVAAVADSVMVMQTGLWRAKRREWPRSEVKTVRVGPSDMEVNDVPVAELQIHGAEGKLFGMLAGRDKRELTWMGTLLRQALKNSGPLSPQKLPPGEDQTPIDANEPVAATSCEEDFDYRGMTINERLSVAGLSDEFADAVGREDRSTMLELLQRVRLAETGAEAYADAVLAEPHQYGY
jgi:hypothetical protein